MTYPFVAGDVLTAADMNALPAYTLNAQTGTTYTAVANDQYSQVGNTVQRICKHLQNPYKRHYSLS
jgi:hypothetical protein